MPRSECICTAGSEKLKPRDLQLSAISSEAAWICPPGGGWHLGFSEGWGGGGRLLRDKKLRKD